MPDGVFKLHGSPHAAELVDPEHFQLRPYVHNAPLNGDYYAGIQWRNGAYIPCVVHCSKTAREAINKNYWPGGVMMRFIQQESLDWLVAFHAQHALIFAYVKLSDDDMRALLEAGIPRT